MVGLGLATICQDAAYAGSVPAMTEMIMAAATASIDLEVCTIPLLCTDPLRAFSTSPRPPLSIILTVNK